MVLYFAALAPEMVQLGLHELDHALDHAHSHAHHHHGEADHQHRWMEEWNQYLTSLQSAQEEESDFPFSLELLRIGQHLLSCAEPLFLNVPNLAPKCFYGFFLASWDPDPLDPPPWN